MMFITTSNENILNKSLWKSKMAAGSHLWKVPFFHYQASFIVHTNLAYLIQMFRPSWFHFWYLISILMSNVCWPLFSIKKKQKHMFKRHLLIVWPETIRTIIVNRKKKLLWITKIATGCHSCKNRISKGFLIATDDRTDWSIYISPNVFKSLIPFSNSSFF